MLTAGRGPSPGTSARWPRYRFEGGRRAIEVYWSDLRPVPERWPSLVPKVFAFTATPGRPGKRRSFPDDPDPRRVGLAGRAVGGGAWSLARSKHEGAADFARGWLWCLLMLVPLIFVALSVTLPLGAVAAHVRDLVGGERRGSLSLDLVRPYTAEADVLTIYGLSALRLAASLEYLLGPLRDVFRVLGDLVFYLDPGCAGAELPDRLDRRLGDLLAYLRPGEAVRADGGGLLIVGHSQGTIIASEVLKRLDERLQPTRLLLLGSPIGSFCERFPGRRVFDRDWPEAIEVTNVLRFEHVIAGRSAERVARQTGPPASAGMRATGRSPTSSGSACDGVGGSALAGRGCDRTGTGSAVPVTAAGCGRPRRTGGSGSFSPSRRIGGPTRRLG